MEPRIVRQAATPALAAPLAPHRAIASGQARVPDALAGDLQPLRIECAEPYGERTSPSGARVGRRSDDDPHQPEASENARRPPPEQEREK
ncbi:MAG: hypothetical protein KDA22_02045 [Phycisphaerales bacterium]|nr:hypothetical protein [Phycisphaerales bacterium]